MMQRAFICLTTEPSSVEKVLERIRAVEGVEEANMVFGGYDVCFSMKNENLDKLKYVLTENITKNKDVRGTLTLVMAEPE